MFLQVLCVVIALQTPARGIVGKEAPSLRDVAWIHKINDVTPTIKKGARMEFRQVLGR
ncbi:MAG: hypothetical protein HOC21_00665 [Phycisphaerae bacterium]|nr:hypothetical protein [Phycisphaerae bacterium]